MKEFIKDHKEMFNTLKTVYNENKLEFIGSVATVCAIFGLTYFSMVIFA